MNEPLMWMRERGTQTAHIVGGRYVVQPELIVTKGVQRYVAMFIQVRGRTVRLGYHPHAAKAKVECQTHYNRRTRWDEDIEAGAVG